MIRNLVYYDMSDDLGMLIAYIDAIYDDPKWRPELPRVLRYLGKRLHFDDEIMEIKFNLLCFFLKDSIGDDNAYIRDSALEGLFYLSGSHSVGIKAIYKMYDSSINDPNKNVRNAAKEYLEEALFLFM